MNKGKALVALLGVVLAGCLQPTHERTAAESSARAAEYREREENRAAENKIKMAAIGQATKEMMAKCASDYVDLPARMDCINIVSWEAYAATNDVYPDSYSKDVFNLYAAETVSAAVAKKENRISSEEFNARLNKASADHNLRQGEYRRAMRRDRQERYQTPPPFSCVEHRGVLTCQ
jgi:hypothetical protein